MMDLSLLETNAGRMDQALYWSKRAFTYGPNVPVSYYQVSIPLTWLDNDAGARWAEAASPTISALQRRREAAAGRARGHRVAQRALGRGAESPAPDRSGVAEEHRGADGVRRSRGALAARRTPLNTWIARSPRDSPAPRVLFALHASDRASVSLHPRRQSCRGEAADRRGADDQSRGPRIRRPAAFRN